MSSVTRFLRQIPLSTTYYSADGVVQNLVNTVFEFLPSSSNYVGNYPNGFNDTTGGVVVSAGAPLLTAITSAVEANGGTSGTSGNAGRCLLRDMGKTIFAPVVSGLASAPGTGSATSPWGYFRQVQLVAPTGITQGPGFMGGVTGNTFGVLGAANTPDVYTDYLTFYIPVSVAGIAGGTSNGTTITPINAKAYALAGGQM
jgi:hypothetical protein